MHSSSIREACLTGCCPTPIRSLLDSQTHTPKSTGSSSAYHGFVVATALSLLPNTPFTNHESLPTLHESFFNFVRTYPQYYQTELADQIRGQEYYHLTIYNRVCLDYVGHGLFSHSQQRSHSPEAPVAASSSSPLPSPHFHEVPFFDISYKSVNLNSQIIYGDQESELETKLRLRIMAFMNISQVDYNLVLTANQSSAFKLLADCYPFQYNRNLLTVYDYQSEAVEMMTKSSKNRGAQVLSAEFSWPNLSIQSGKLRKMLKTKRKDRKRGLFVFPLQSRMTGSRYSYQWMSIAQENGWHVLLDACALGPKDMDTLGLSLFKPDFLICSFYKVFGENPSGFSCLFIKKSSASVLKDSANATRIGVVGLVQASRTPEFTGDQAITEMEIDQKMRSELWNDDLVVPHSISGPLCVQQESGETSKWNETEGVSPKQKAVLLSEIVELETPFESAGSKYKEGSVNGSSDIECRGLDHADSLGLMLISSRHRYLINWLVNALMSLQHPHSENGHPLVRIYGPKVSFNRGPAVAFNVFDWKGEQIDPTLVQKLADRNNISLSSEFLKHVWLSDKHEEEREKALQTRKIEFEGTVLHKKSDKYQPQTVPVVTAALGLFTNFEDIYRLWAFVSQFLDADFVEKERWRYTALNQERFEV
ncbi:molybdenum cofactor sulfurase-like [Juglans microcarpa x Juglans regia]|uniref:molybdenum cofactor sulfurase-like n=1 Tax=Juglans microcarpa x Juglans regia TaxID=2249226 RepID=UPI001B7E1365|nr:molybdenum cofactor sulfurase-like [Juglans microcarpa x Juglans regia]